MSTQVAVPRLPRKPVSQTIHGSFDVERIRADFPILRELIHGRPLVYLDNAAT